MSDDFERPACLFCGSEDLETVADRGQHGLPCHVSICPRDGLVFLSPRWTKNRYGRFYAKEYDRYYRPQVLGSETDDERYRTSREIASRLDAVRPDLRPKAILDVGSGMGWTVEHLAKRFGANRSAAIEASERCLANLRELGVEAVGSDLESDWHLANEKSFDLVVLRHVLEHTLDPVELLRRVRHVLADGGSFYLAVPNMMKPRGLLEEYWFRVVHTYYFGPETLQAAIADAGLEVVALREEGAEIWAICSTGEPTASPDLSRVHRRQLDVIERHRRSEPALRWRRRVASLARKILPTGR